MYNKSNCKKKESSDKCGVENCNDNNVWLKSEAVLISVLIYIIIIRNSCRQETMSSLISEWIQLGRRSSSFEVILRGFKTHTHKKKKDTGEKLTSTYEYLLFLVFTFLLKIKNKKKLV